VIIWPTALLNDSGDGCINKTINVIVEISVANRIIERKIRFVSLDLGELVRQTDAVRTHVNYLYIEYMLYNRKGKTKKALVQGGAAQRGTELTARSC